MPDISDIPNASVLQIQLAALETSVQALKDGANITNVTISADPSVATSAPVPIALNPPLTDATLLAEMTTALQHQADAITQQLIAMGFTDTGTVVTRSTMGMGPTGLYPPHAPPVTTTVPDTPAPTVVTPMVPPPPEINPGPMHPEIEPLQP